MSEAATDRCQWCRRPIAQREGAGRPRLYCCRSHRQRAYESRRRSEDLGLPEGQCVVQVRDLDALHDLLYELETAVLDARGDVADDASPASYRAAFTLLLHAAQSLRGTVIEPVRT